MVNCKLCNFPQILARGVCSTCYSRFQKKGRLNELQRKQIKGRDFPCNDCEEIIEKKGTRKKCGRCYAREREVNIYFFGQNINIKVEPELKVLIKQIVEEEKNKVYIDFDKNPRKWLDSNI